MDSTTTYENGMEITFSKRRPAASAWCVRGNGRTTYAATREEAIRSHQSKLSLLAEYDEMIKKCVEVSLKRA